ncbi:MAG: hypothetical protein JW967_10425 [Dehalococcoidales bacterium]|nr:hypothetical protein [Dehalococcoidales bacterium]
MSVREIDRFKARTDKGKEYIIVQYQEYISTDSFDGTGEIEGLKSIFTSTGLHVNFIDAKTFKVVETDEIVRKV